MSGPEHSDWENDPVWNLIDEAKGPAAGPMFVRNVMRQVRLSEEAPMRWWQRLLAPRPLLAGALGAAAVVVVVANLNPDRTADPSPGFSQAPPPAPAAETPVAETSPLDELLKEEMLFAAAENPGAFTDEALLELLR